MKQTLLQLIDLNRLEEKTGGPARAEEYVRVMLARLPAAGERREQYLGDVARFMADALDGIVSGPDHWTDRS